MEKVYILYNPKSGKGTGEQQSKKIPGVDAVYVDITTVTDYEGFFSGLDKEDKVVIAGGDGTLSRFAGNVAKVNINNPVYYYATGSGNDFLKDLNKQKGDEAFIVNEYIKAAPAVSIDSEEYRFVNGVGGGLDAYACEIGNKLHEKGKESNYVLNAVKGILYDYKPMSARISVDGVVHEFKNVWFASVMKGRYFGGGIMLAPKQDRTTGKLSLVVVHSVGRLKLLTIIPGAFKGKHVKYKQYVEVIQGENITVEFDRPVPVQYDGETVENVTGYGVKTKNEAIF